MDNFESEHESLLFNFIIFIMDFTFIKYEHDIFCFCYQVKRPFQIIIAI